MHIAVDWERPTVSDFEVFAAVMEMPTKGQTLVHCEVNFRASVFGFLYQVLYRDVPIETAISLLHSVWLPNEVWEEFIANVLAASGFEYHCEFCF